MLIVGSLLALVCGLANSTAAALEKRESVLQTSAGTGLRLLVVLARRGWWLLAMALSVLAWVAEAGALALAPIPVVTSLRSAGRGGLVLVGHHWLGERFGRVELTGVGMLAVGGVLVATSVAGGGKPALPLSNLTEGLVALGVGLVALALSRLHSGLLLGGAVGVLYVATGVFTKEVGDRFAREGLAAVPGLLLTPGPWVMVLFSVAAISVTQRAFQRANAASVAAASTAISADGLILAGLLLYKEPLGRGAAAVPLVVGIVISTLGAIALAIGGGRSRDGSARPGEGVSTG